MRGCGSQGPKSHEKKTGKKKRGETGIHLLRGSWGGVEGPTKKKRKRKNRKKKTGIHLLRGSWGGVEGPAQGLGFRV